MEDPELIEHLDEYIDEFHALIKSIVRCPKPTHRDARRRRGRLRRRPRARVRPPRRRRDRAYVQEKFVKIGLMPDGGGTFWLPRLVGTARAMQLDACSPRRSTAPSSTSLGLVDRSSSRAASCARHARLCARAREGPAARVRAIKRVVYASWGDLEDALAREREGQLKLLRSQDAMEGDHGLGAEARARLRGEVAQSLTLAATFARRRRRPRATRGARRRSPWRARPIISFAIAASTVMSPPEIAPAAFAAAPPA